MAEKMRFCAVCKQEIELERRVDPETGKATMTRLCQKHGKAIEKFGGEFVRLVTQERTSKQSSIKRNYGAVTVELVRNDEAIARLRDEYLDNQGRS